MRQFETAVERVAALSARVRLRFDPAAAHPVHTGWSSSTYRTSPRRTRTIASRSAVDLRDVRHREDSPSGFVHSVVVAQYTAVATPIHPADCRVANESQGSGSWRFVSTAWATTAASSLSPLNQSLRRCSQGRNYHHASRCRQIDWCGLRSSPP